MKTKTIVISLLLCIGLVVEGCGPLTARMPDPGALPVPTFQPPVLGESTASPPPATDDQPPQDNSLMLMYGLIALLSIVVLFGFLALLQKTNKPPE